jgi:hypothetical protein
MYLVTALLSELLTNNAAAAIMCVGFGGPYSWLPAGFAFGAVWRPPRIANRPEW